jgi:hypothetical protein
MNVPVEPGKTSEQQPEKRQRLEEVIEEKDKAWLELRAFYRARKHDWLQDYRIQKFCVVCQRR